MASDPSTLALVIGAVSAAAVGLFANRVGYDRDGAFYPTVLTVVAAIYVLFAVMAGGGEGLVPELLFFALFAALAVAGFRSTLWLAAAGLLAHGLFDFLRHASFAAPGAPEWWPAFCGAYDVVAALGLALLLRARQTGFRAQP